MIHFAASQVNVAPAPRDKAFLSYTDAYRADIETVNNGCSNGYFCWKPLLRATNAWTQSRVVVPTYDTVGLSSFAVTYSGAKRLLYHLSYKELTDTLDRSIATLFKDGELHGWSVVPPLMSEWKVDGKRDTNLRTQDPGRTIGSGNMKGHSAGLKWSVRKQMAIDLEVDDYWENEKHYWSNVRVDAPKSDVAVDPVAGSLNVVPAVAAADSLAPAALAAAPPKEGAADSF